MAVEVDDVVAARKRVHLQEFEWLVRKFRCGSWPPRQVERLAMVLLLWHWLQPVFDTVC
jgi:hypothetical protein